MMKPIRHPMFLGLTILVIGTVFAIILSSIVGLPASNMNTANVAYATKKHPHKHIVPNLPPRRVQVHSSALLQPLNTPKHKKTLPVRNVNAAKASVTALATTPALVMFAINSQSQSASFGGKWH